MHCLFSFVTYALHTQTVSPLDFALCIRHSFADEAFLFQKQQPSALATTNEKATQRKMRKFSFCLIKALIFSQAV